MSKTKTETIRVKREKIWPIFGEVLENYFGQEESWEMENGELYTTTTLEHMDKAEFAYEPENENVYEFRIGISGYTYKHQIRKSIVPDMTEKEFKDEIRFACKKVKQEAETNEH
ncbi:MAG: hypothetical protein ABEH43_04575 [Flavobacteriales bacterium]